MKVLKINFLSQSKFINQQTQTNPIKQNNLSITNNVSVNYPKNYRPYFGARLNRTPENFYEQEFNIQNMPVTMKNLLNADFANNKLKRPMELQQEAFSWIGESETIQDVKDMYPDEPLFADLETLETIRPKHGILCDLRILGAKNNTVLKSGEDLTVYLLKKIYLEGKDLSEINEDFKKDVEEKFLDEEHYPEGYFQYSTLKSLGVHFPDVSYWHSLQATRLDKEYIFTHRTIDPTKERKPRVYAPRKPRVISKEERQKRSERMIEKWLDMSPTQRANQIAKMRAGLLESDNIFMEYMSPIVAIAAEQIHLSDKLLEFFRKDADVEYPEDLANLSNKQHAKMKKFWDKNKYLKQQFSKTVQETVACFELAKFLNDGSLEKLVKGAEVIKQKNETRAKLRELSSDEGLAKTVTEQVKIQGLFLPESYTKAYTDFVLKSSEYQKDIKPRFAQLIYQPDNENLREIIQNSLNNLANKYEREYKRFTIAARLAMASVYMQFESKDLSVLTASGFYISTKAEKSMYKDLIMSKKPEIEKRMKEYTTGLSAEELNTAYNLLISMMKKAATHGYSTLSNINIRNKTSKLSKILDKLKNKNIRREFKEFLKDYEGYIKYANSVEVKQLSKIYLYESIIDDYIDFYDKKLLKS